MEEDKKLPLISVIIPNYNYARYLRQRIESVLNQTFTDFEVILLDDASTDDSVTILETYCKHSQVSQIVINDINTGSPFKQWMKGILLARGKYVWIAEADDLAEPTFLETCVSYLEQYEGASICNVGSQLIDAEGKIINKDINHWGKRVKKSASYFDGVRYAERNLYWKNYTINASGILFRREYALRLANSMFLTMRYCGDWLFWFEMAMQGGVIEVYQVLNYFRQHNTKVTMSSHKAGVGIIEDAHVLKRMEELLPHIGSYKKKLRRGLLYRKMKRLSVGKEREKELASILTHTLQVGVSDYYLERLSQILRIFIPTLPCRKRERL